MYIDSDGLDFYCMHYHDVIIGAITSHITSLTIVFFCVFLFFLFVQDKSKTIQYNTKNTYHTAWQNTEE